SPEPGPEILLTDIYSGADADGRALTNENTGEKTEAEQVVPRDQLSPDASRDAGREVRATGPQAG
ncbi:MAG: hypothetical protein M3442_13410, partial [Chloroflexota bacterium]|nr:hypothetical protein [Chloroflexota bacterium]